MQLNTKQCPPQLLAALPLGEIASSHVWGQGDQGKKAQIQKYVYSEKNKK